MKLIFILFTAILFTLLIGIPAVSANDDSNSTTSGTLSISNAAFIFRPPATNDKDHDDIIGLSPDDDDVIDIEDSINSIELDDREDAIESTDTKDSDDASESDGIIDEAGADIGVNANESADRPSEGQPPIDSDNGAEVPQDEISTDLEETINALVPQGRPNGPSGGLNTLDPVGAFGLGLYGARIFDRYASLIQKLKNEQQRAIQFRNQLQRQLKGIARNLTETSQRLKLKYKEQVGELIVIVKNTVRDLVKQDRDISCFYKFSRRIVEIRSEIKLLNVDMTKVKALAEINKLSAKLVNGYDRVLGVCRNEHPFILRQIRGIEICVSDKLKELELEKDSAMIVLQSEVNNLRADLMEIINYRSKRVDGLIAEAYNRFNRKDCSVVAVPVSEVTTSNSTLN